MCHGYKLDSLNWFYETPRRLYTLCSKNIPDIFDCNLKTNQQILVIFGKNIPDTTCHEKNSKIFSPEGSRENVWGPCKIFSRAPLWLSTGLRPSASSISAQTTGSATYSRPTSGGLAESALHGGKQ